MTATRAMGTGCQSDCATPRCGDGVVDPEEACDDGNRNGDDGCSAQCSSDETCANGVVDIAQGEECDDGGLETGDGCGATCRIEVCGNGLIDPGEVCDDGNNRAGDGCGPACRSDETCGNGVPDFGSGEQCDDANYRSGDGCSSQCTAELPVFTQRSLDQPGARYSRMVYDSAHDRLVRFGGTLPLGEPTQGTILLHAEGQASLPPVGGPPARVGHVLVYDALRRVVVLFGGQSIRLRRPGMPPPPATPLADTWELGANQWVPRTPGQSPPAIEWAAGAYDAARREVVLFGGLLAGVEQDATWTYDGARWTRREPARRP